MTDPEEAGRAAAAVARNSGFALALEGVNPLRVGDEQLRERFAGRPVVRVEAAEPVYPEWHDPGSPWWGLPHIVLPAGVLSAVRTLRRR